MTTYYMLYALWVAARISDHIVPFLLMWQLHQTLHTCSPCDLQELSITELIGQEVN